jgi:hypothetical protein
MVIYDTVRRTCEEQRKIVDEVMDRTVLSSVVKGLPRWAEVEMHFRMTVKGQKSLARVVLLLLPNDHENEILGTPYPSRLASYMDCKIQRRLGSNQSVGTQRLG